MLDEQAHQKREANRFMREALRALDPSEPIAFFCECDRPRCDRVVLLSGQDYDRFRTDETWRALALAHGARDVPRAIRLM